MARRVLGLAAALLLVVAACGGDTPTPRAGGPGSAPTALEAAEAAVASLGDDLTAASAVVLALDRGYTLVQVVDAIMGRDLRDTGVVVRSGAVVEPEGTASDVIVDKSPPQASGTFVLAVGVVAGGPAVTEEEFIGHLIAFSLGLEDEFERQRVEAEERARQEQEEAAARAAEEAERLERLRTAAVTLTMLDLSARGYSAEQIIFALVLGLVQCDAVPVPLPDWRCDIVGETPAEDEAGVFASEQAFSPVATVPPAGPSVVADGYYRATFEPDYGDFATIDSARVSMIVSEGRYALNVNVDYTTVWTSADGSLSCTNWHEVSYSAEGDGSDTSIFFTGRMTNDYTSTCEEGGLFSSSDEWTVRVLVPDLTGRFQGGDFRLAKED